MDDERIADIENAILRSSLSVEEIAIVYGVSAGIVRGIMNKLLIVA